MLPTILSRVQRFDFKRIAVDEIVSRLRKIAQDEHIQIDEESLHVIAKKADGALRDALGLMDQAIAFCGDQITHNELLQALNVVGTERLFEFMQCVKVKDADAGLQLINTLLQEGYDIQEFLIGLTEHLRNLYIAHHSPQLYLVEASEDTKARYKEAAKDFSRDDLMRMMHMISEAQIKLKDANQPRIQFEITLLKLIHMEKSENLAKLLAELEEVKKNFRNQGLAPRQAEEGKELQSDIVPEVQSGEGTELQSDRVPEVQSGEVTELQSDKVPEKLSTETEQIQNSETIIVSEKKNQPPHSDSTTSKPTPPKPDPIIAEFDMGAPALVTEVTHQAQKIHLSSNGNNIVTAEVATEHVQEFNRNPDKKITFEEVRAAWPTFLETLSTRVPKILELQVQRVKPTELNGMELTLECDNPLSQRMLKEQEMELTPILKEQIGCRLRFNPVVVQVNQSKQKRVTLTNDSKKFRKKTPFYVNW